MTKLSASRRAALSTLLVARERSAYVRDLLNSKAGQQGLEGLSDEDRAFATRLALGVASTWGTLDEVIDRFVTRPESLQPDVREALRIATFELLFLRKSPHAAVSQGVELVKTRAKSAAGLANAVLRRVSESAEEFMAESDAHRFGLPAWLFERFVQDVGAQHAADLGAAGLDQAPTYIATVPMWVTDRRADQLLAMAGIVARPAGAVPGSWRAQDARVVASSELLTGEEAQIVVADYGAQLVACLASPEPGERVLEVGSGRGTKSVLMAGHAHRRGGVARIWALDLHESKAAPAAERLRRARVEGVTQVTGDARRLGAIAGLPPHFDRILVDAPCSGTGTLRRHPEIAWSLEPRDVTSCARTQLDMLVSCGERLASGGVMTYATCSVLAEENEGVVEAFLANEVGAQFEVVPVADMAAATGIVELVDEVGELSGSQGYLRTYPRPDGCDGHFCACLRKR